MRLLLLSQLRFLQRASWSAVSALVGVSLGVASVVAVHLISARVQGALEATAPPHLSGLTHVLERDAVDADAYFALRDWWRRHPAARIEALVPLVEGHVAVAGSQPLVIGADWLAMPAGGGGGRPLAVSTDVLVGSALLADPALGLDPGDRITVRGRTYRVAGVHQSGFGAALLADIAAAQHMLGAGPTAVGRVGLRLHDPWQAWRRRLDALMPGIGAGLPAPGAAALDTLLSDAAGLPPGWRAVPLAAERPSAAFARSVLFNLGALGTLALLVAWFLVYQVAETWLRRQQVVLEHLHQVGVPQAWLRRSFLLPFLGVGGVATLGGAAIGVVLATVLGRMTSQALDVTLAGTLAAALDPWLAAKALGSGVGVCLLGGIAAFARQHREPDRSRWRWLVAPLLLAVAVAGIVVEASGVLGAFAAILAMSLLGVAAVAPALGLLRRAGAVRRGRLVDRLALREVGWSPGILNVALAALTLAVATGMGVALMVESFRLDFAKMLTVRLAGDLYVSGPADHVAAAGVWLAERPGVTRLARFGEARTRIAGRPVEVGYARFDAAESARYGHAAPLAAGEALVSEALARALGVAAGDRLATGAAAQLEVVGVFPGFGEPQGRVLVDVSSLPRLGLEPAFGRLSVDLDGPRPELAQSLGGRFPGLQVESRAAVRAVALDIFDRTFATTQALTLLALLVAGVGTYNALTALRLQQAASTRLLEAQGLTTGELRRIGLLRTSVVGAAAVALAVPLGVAMAWTLCAVVNPRSFGWSIDLQLPASGWLPPLLLGLAATLLAGLLPAPRDGVDPGDGA